MEFYSQNGDYLIGGEIQLATRKNRPIRNKRRFEQHPARLQAAKRIVLDNHETARLRSLTGLYNCMGMLFAARRTWIDPDELQMILEDDNYHKLNYNGEVKIGDIIVYKEGDDITHVGMVSEVKPELQNGNTVIYVLSQWGQDGEYFHRYDDVNPRLGVPFGYWTERV